MSLFRWAAPLAGLLLAGGLSAQAVTASHPQATSPAQVAASATPAAPTAPVGAATSPVLDKHDVDVWLDGFMPYALKASDIAGAEIVIVKDGQILTERGFGYADLATRRPVDPEKILFRPGSVSKLITWTAVMQMVEQGKIDLDRDVNDYLDFKIESFHGQPVTMRELMAHAAGFEEKAKYLMTYDPARAMTTEAFLKAGQPKRIVAPMTVTAYSNFGASLSGYIVQRVSGERYEDYVQRHIFTPLGMSHSTMYQPLPSEFVANMSKGYTKASEPSAGGFEIVNSIPAGSMSGTASDMARFMMAHLQNGAYEGTQILRPETARMMHYSTVYTPVPGLPGAGFGFYHEDRNGLVIVGHAGDSNFFHSDLHLLVDKNVGFYISMNSGGRDGAADWLRVELFRQFLDRYFPVDRPELPTVATAAADAQLMAGSYLSSRHFENNFLRMIPIISPSVLTAYPNGEISFSVFQGVNGLPKRWREVAPFHWEEVGGSGNLVATVKDGHVVRFMTDDFPPVFSYSPAPYWARGGIVLFVALGVLVLAVLLWPVGLLVRRAQGTKLVLASRDRWVRNGAALGSLSNVLFAAGFTFFILRLAADASVLDSQSDPILRVLQLLALLSFPAAALACWNSFNTWRDDRRVGWSRFGASVVALASIVVVWFAVTLDIITPTLDY